MLPLIYCPKQSIVLFIYCSYCIGKSRNPALIYNDRSYLRCTAKSPTHLFPHSAAECSKAAVYFQYSSQRTYAFASSLSLLQAVLWRTRKQLHASILTPNRLFLKDLSTFRPHELNSQHQWNPAAQPQNLYLRIPFTPSQH